mmetsp:Transcript_86640/g.279800  ORF Transcript_86640/g.279800 Transcript_86640/m.279800 type:complete len:207 (-) Transcript_86640:1367-1987(-)
MSWAGSASGSGGQGRSKPAYSEAWRSVSVFARKKVTTPRPIIHIACHCNCEYLLPKSQEPTATMGRPPWAMTRTVPASISDSALSKASLEAVKQHATGRSAMSCSGATQSWRARRRLRSHVAAMTMATPNEDTVCASTKVPLTKARVLVPCCAQLTSSGRVASSKTKAQSRPGGPRISATMRRRRGTMMAFKRIRTGKQKGASPSS